MIATVIVVLLLSAGLIVLLAVGGSRILRLWALEPVGVAIPLLACAIFLMAPQVRDMMAVMKSGFGGNSGTDVALWREAYLGGAVFMLAVQGWFWTRAALNARGGYRDADAPLSMPWQEQWAPRLGLLPSGLIAISPMLMGLNGDIPLSSVPWLGVAAAVLACVVVAGWAWDRRRRYVNQRQQLVGPVRAPRPMPPSRVARLFVAAPFQEWVKFVLLGASLAGITIAQVAPDAISFHLHTPVAALLALSCAIPIASIALALCRDAAEAVLSSIGRLLGRRYVGLDGVADALGVLLLVLIPIAGSYAAAAFGLYMVDVRPDSTGDLAVGHRPQGVAAAVHTYLGCRGGSTAGHAKMPAIIVATEGGASRSAAWTLSVMHMLDERTGGAFGTHLFAITSVSGGSLGAVTYDLAQWHFGYGTNHAVTNAEQLQFWSRAMPAFAVLATADLLSAAIARMFTADMLFGVPTREQALETAFDHYWRSPQALDISTPGDLRFLATSADHPCLPHLLLNGTDVRTGDRLVTSTIAFDAVRTFPGAVDVLLGQQADITAAAAVMNSARFPLISPPGALPHHSGYQADDLMVIDGGIFENYGARTAAELVDAIKEAPDGDRLDPIVVLISNDFQKAPATCAIVTRTTDSLNAQALAAARLPGQTQGGVEVPEFLTSLLGLYNARGGHAHAEIGTIADRLCSVGGERFFHFDLPAPQASLGESAPMNWVLDANSCHFILGEAARRPNVEEADRFAAVLQAPGHGSASSDDALCDAAGGSRPVGAAAHVASVP